MEGAGKTGTRKTDPGETHFRENYTGDRNRAGVALAVSETAVDSWVSGKSVHHSDYLTGSTLFLLPDSGIWYAVESGGVAVDEFTACRWISTVSIARSGARAVVGKGDSDFV